MKTDAVIEAALLKIDSTGPSKYTSMTYEEGIEFALRWALGDISDEEFEENI